MAVLSAAGPGRAEGGGEASSLAGLVRCAQGGDRAAFGVLYERFGRYVRGILLAHVEPADVPDLLQDVFLRALASLATLREPGAFGPWVAEIARNVARARRRGSRGLIPLEDAPPLAAPEPPLRSEVVLRAIQSLPPAYREPLILRLVEGMSGVEIAERTGLTDGSVRVNLHRGMAQLREKLGEHA